MDGSTAAVNELDGRQPVLHQRAGDPHGQPDGDGHGEAPQLGRDHRGERRHHEQGEVAGIEPDDRGRQHADQPGQPDADRPDPDRHGVGTGPRQRGHRRGVDHGPHSQAHVGVAQDGGADDHDRHDAAVDDDLVHRDRHAQELEDPDRLGGESGGLQDRLVAEDDRAERGEGHRHPEGGDHLDQRGGQPQEPEQSEVQEDAEGGPQHRGSTGAAAGRIAQCCWEFK